jgi:hypothetical protein
VQKNLNLKQRGVIHSEALPDGSQEIEDLGPWGRERQRNLDQEVLEQSKRFITDTDRHDRFIAAMLTIEIQCR